MFLRVLLVLILTGPLSVAQKGDKAGEVQVAPVAPEIIPAAPPLSPEAALKTFKLPPGFRIELVASEPLIEAPVSMAFDPDGRLWVLEMRGFMPDADGKDEDTPNGRVTVLEDTDGDGRMDKRTVFQDGLVLPRALALVRGGVLVAEPPKLWFCRDTNGDGKADEKIEVANDYGAAKNPEHTANGLMWALDNWIYSANHTIRFRNLNGQWERESTVSRGQWGISQDDFGRLFHNSNSDQLRADLVPSQYLRRNPNYRTATGANVQLAKDQSVWPIRVNPGVNRAYQKGQLRADGTLATFTAACAPVIYRGDNFPAELRGNAFLCEPAGNLVRRNLLVETNGSITAKNAYREAEFLASTDERFRPVNLFNAPDGALYVVDMYRGIIQHRIYVTTYLRNQILSRGLEKPLDRGRIYRIVYGAKPLSNRPQLTKASEPELVKTLSHPGGWWRDTAQRLLIERRDFSVVPALQELAVSGREPLGRLHALWTLDGLGKLDQRTLLTALSDPHPKLRTAAIRLCEPLLKSESKAEVLPKLLDEAEDTDAEVRLQLVFTLGEINTPELEKAIAMILQKHAENVLQRDAALTGLGGRELEFLERLLADSNWAEKRSGRGELFGNLAKCVLTEGKESRVNHLLELIAAQSASSWRQIALLDGLISTAPKAAKNKTAAKPKPLRVAAQPAALGVLGKVEDNEVRRRVEVVSSLLAWPGKAGVEAETKMVPLTKEQQERFESGKSLYAVTCGACHQPTGLGQEGLAPPLVDSDWVMGPDQRLVRIVLHGVRGPITVKGTVYQLEMPSLAVFDDDQIAGILTYIRREWGHTAAPVEPAVVKTIRAETEKRQEAWTEAELLKIP